MTLRIWSRILWGLLRVNDEACAIITEINEKYFVNDVNCEIDFVNYNKLKSLMQTLKLNLRKKLSTLMSFTTLSVRTIRVL